MKLITLRTQLRDFPARWRKQYDGADYAFVPVVAKALETYDPETATPQDLAALLGNSSWCEPKECNECKEAFDVLVQLGDEPDYDSNTAFVCLACLQKAVELASRA